MAWMDWITCAYVREDTIRQVGAWMERMRPSMLWCWDGTGQCDVDETVDCRACLLPLLCSVGAGAASAPSSPPGTMFQKQLRVGRTPESSQGTAKAYSMPAETAT